MVTSCANIHGELEDLYRRSFPQVYTSADAKLQQLPRQISKHLTGYMLKFDSKTRWVIVHIGNMSCGYSSSFET
jgi:hypothetical protein